MSLRMLVALTVCLSTWALFAQQTPAPPQNPAEPDPRTLQWTSKQKISYVMGRNMGEQIKAEQQQLGIDLAILMEGLQTALAGQAACMTTAQIDEAIAAFEKEMQEMQAAEMAKMQAAAGQNADAGVQFLANNKTQPGVQTLPSGLQYKVLQQGTGRTPTLTDKVTVHYHGTLIDGRVFDSSVQRGRPIELAVNGVIKGWTEALQLMKEGDKWQLFIPADLAYGPTGQGPIGPNAVLIFDVELIKVN